MIAKIMDIREIVLDTETTGLDAEGGDRIIEVGCVELVDFIATDKSFHKYLDPERAVSASATRIHGITSEMLIGMPKFSDIASEFLDFIGDSPLIIHNARFDVRFLEVELERIGKKGVLKNAIVDTLEIARKKFPGMPASLDALCKRFNISLLGRELHGALKDASLLARVYVELCGGLQRSLTFSGLTVDANSVADTTVVDETKQTIISRSFPLSPEEKKLHRESILSKIHNPIWSMYFEREDDNAG